MATTIKLKNGSGAPLAGDLVQGEPAFDLTNKRLYTENSGGTVIEVGTNPTSLTTGTITSGDITVADATPFIRLQDSDVTNGYTQISNINGNGYIGARNDSANASFLIGGYGGGTFTEFARWSDAGDLTQKNNLIVQGTFTSLGIDDNATSTAITIDASENVGIGVTDPDNLLTVGGGTQPRILIRANGDSGASQFNFGDASDVDVGRLRYDHSDNSMSFFTSATERMRIDSSGNVGIGTASPSTALEVLSPASGTGALKAQNASGASASTAIFEAVSGGDTTRLLVQNDGNVGIGTTSPNRLFEVAGNNNGGAKANYLRITDTDTTATANNQQGGIEFYASDASAGAGVNASIEVLYAGSGGGGEITFNTASNSGTGISEAVRIDETGNLLVGTTVTTINTTNFGTRISSTVPGYLASYRDVTGSSVAVLFGGNAGQVYVRGDGDLENTNNNYGAISDERLKSDIVDASSQINDIMAVQVRSYTLNETGATHIGVVAQELEASGMSGLVKTDDEGMKSVKYSILYMKAIKALQEAVTRIETLEAEVAALKGE